MNNKQKDYAALGLQGAGLVGGAVASVYGSPVAGAAIVGAANVGAAAIQASKSAPKTPGSSGEQNALLALQMQQANKAAGLEGLSAQQIADIQDVNFNQALKMQQVINSYSQIKGMDIASQQILADQIIQDMTNQKRDITREIAMMDATAISKNLAIASETSQAAMQTATVIRNIEADKRDKELRFKEANANALKGSIVNSVRLIGSAYAYQKALDRENAKNAAGQKTIDTAANADTLKQAPAAASMTPSKDNAPKNYAGQDKPYNAGNYEYVDKGGNIQDPNLTLENSYTYEDASPEVQRQIDLMIAEGQYETRAEALKAFRENTFKIPSSTAYARLMYGTGE